MLSNQQKRELAKTECPITFEMWVKSLQDERQNLLSIKPVGMDFDWIMERVGEIDATLHSQMSAMLGYYVFTLMYPRYRKMYGANPKP